MSFKCPECDGEETLPGSYFETCANCGYCSVDRLTQVKMLVRIIEKKDSEIAALKNASVEVLKALGLFKINLNGMLIEPGSKRLANGATANEAVDMMNSSWKLLVNAGSALYALVGVSDLWDSNEIPAWKVKMNKVYLLTEMERLTGVDLTGLVGEAVMETLQELVRSLEQ